MKDHDNGTAGQREHGNNGTTGQRVNGITGQHKNTNMRNREQHKSQQIHNNKMDFGQISHQFYSNGILDSFIQSINQIREVIQLNPLLQ